MEDRNLHHPDNEPLWAAIESLGLPICIHDSGSPYWPSYGDRMETHTSGHIIAHPFEAMVAMMSLIWFGVIERHPNLKILHVEADAGWLPYWLQRQEQHWEFSGNAEHPELKDIELVQFRTYGAPGRDPRGRTISIVYYSILNGNISKAKAGDDAAEVAWFDMNNLPPPAFDHDLILRDFISQIIKKQ